MPMTPDMTIDAQNTTREHDPYTRTEESFESLVWIRPLVVATIIGGTAWLGWIRRLWPPDEGSLVAALLVIGGIGHLIRPPLVRLQPEALEYNLGGWITQRIDRRDIRFVQAGNTRNLKPTIIVHGKASSRLRVSRLPSGLRYQDGLVPAVVEWAREGGAVLESQPPPELKRSERRVGRVQRVMIVALAAPFLLGALLLGVLAILVRI